MKPKVEIKNILEAPNLLELKHRFGVTEKETIIAYGDKIYCPNAGMSKDLLVHEMMHCERQNFSADSAKRWWKMYLEDESFRLQEEIIAYQNQYAYCCAIYKDRNKRVKILSALASELSSSRYGKIIIHSEAMHKIKIVV